MFSKDGKSVGIPNDDGDFLFVPKEMLELYVSASPLLIEKLAENVTSGRELYIGTIYRGVRMRSSLI